MITSVVRISGLGCMFCLVGFGLSHKLAYIGGFELLACGDVVWMMFAEPVVGGCRFECLSG